MRAGLLQLLSLLLLALIIAVSCFPFVLMFFGSFKEDYEIFTLSPKLLPQNGFSLAKYYQLFASWPFGRAMMNSIVVAVATTAGACFFAPLSGFTFAKYRFPGKNFLFVLVLATLMLPLETRLVPTYMLFRGIGGADKLWSLILPGLTPAFGVFMMRQFASNGVPTETMEAARIEGASETHILFRIAFPMLAPGIFSLAILDLYEHVERFSLADHYYEPQGKPYRDGNAGSIGDVSMNGGYGILFGGGHPERIAHSGNV